MAQPFQDVGPTLFGLNANPETYQQAMADFAALDLLQYASKAYWDEGSAGMVDDPWDQRRNSSRGYWVVRCPQAILGGYTKLQAVHFSVKTAQEVPRLPGPSSLKSDKHPGFDALGSEMPQ